MPTAPLIQATKKSVTGVSSTTKAFDSDVVAGHLLIVAVAIYDPASVETALITTPTDTQTNDYISYWAEGFETTPRDHVNIFYAVAKSSGPCTVTVGQTNSSGTYLTALLAEFDAINTTPCLTARAEGKAASGTTAASAALEIEAGVLLIGFCDTAVSSGTATFTESGTWLNAIKETNADTSYPVCALEYQVWTGGSVAAGYTVDNVRWICLLAGFLPVETDAVGWTAPTLSDTGVSTGAQSVVGYPDLRPNALYDAAAGAGGQTIVPFVAGATANLGVVVYDHATQAWLTPQYDLDTRIADDGHGSASIILGADGKYHIYWGCHNTALQYVRSTNAHDPSAWTVQTDVDSVVTYPNACVASNGHQYVLYRAGYGHTVDWGRNLSTDHGATWSGPTSVLTGTATYSWYLSVVQSGDTIHVIVTWNDESNTLASGYPLTATRRYGLYYFRVNDFGNTETYTASDGTSLTLPITQSDLTAHCTVRAVANPLFDQEPRVAVGLDGYPAIISVRGTDINHVASFMKYNGSTWSSPVTICASGIDYAQDCGALANTGANAWVAFIVRRGTTGLTGDQDATDNPVDSGGQVTQYESADDGATWTRKGAVSSRTHVNFVADVINGIAPISYLLADYVDMGAGNGNILGFVPGTQLAALTGTALAGITEADLVAGGNTVIVTVTGDTFIPA